MWPCCCLVLNDVTCHRITARRSAVEHDVRLSGSIRKTACSEWPETQIRAMYLMEPARRQVQRLARMQAHDPRSLPPLYSG